MTTEDQIRNAIQAALQALAVSEGSIRAAENAARATRETLTALLAVITQAPPVAEEWLDADAILKRYPVLTRRAVLDARRKGKLRASKPDGSRSMLCKLADVEEWIHGRKGKP